MRTRALPIVLILSFPLLAASSAGCSSATNDGALGEDQGALTTPTNVYVQPMQPGTCNPSGSPVKVSFEASYIAGVVTGETGFLCGAFGLTNYACLAHYEAQAVAARTYVMHAIAGDSSLGASASHPILGGPCFQAWNASPGALEVQSATATAGVVMSHNSALIAANYDSGGGGFDSSGNPLPPSHYHSSPYASWDAARSACCSSGNPSQCVFPGSADDGVWTQIFVTDNQNKSGNAVTPTCQSSGAQDRGALGQWWSAELAYRWVDGTFTYQDILKFFYGADVAFGQPPQTKPASGVGAASGKCTSSEIASSRANGVNYWTCEGSARYLCDDLGNKIVEACPSGCAGAGALADDQCAGGAQPQCSASEYANQNVSGASYWTCEGKARYVCDGKNDKVTESCASSCVGAGYAKDDQCQ